MGSTDISAEADQILSVLSRWREPGRLSKVAAVRKWWNRKKNTNQRCRDLFPTLQEHKATVWQKPDHFSIFQSSTGTASESRADRAALMFGGSGREQGAVEQRYSLGFAHSLLQTCSQGFLIFLSASVFLTVTKWFMSQFSSGLASAKRSKKWM